MGLFGNKVKNDALELTYSASSSSQTPYTAHIHPSAASQKDTEAGTSTVAKSEVNQKKNMNYESDKASDPRESRETKKLKGIMSRLAQKGEDEEETPTVASMIEDDPSLVDTVYTGGASLAEETVRTVGTVGTSYQDRSPIKPEIYVTAYLLQWKSASEDGYPLLRFAMVIGALGVIVTSLIPLVQDQYGKAPFTTGLLATYSIIGACAILILEFRYLNFRNPYGCRARLRNLITKHASVLRLVWGRGWLAMLVGLLTMAQEWDVTLVSGAVMIVIGSLGAVMGGYAAHKMEKLRSSLTDETQVWLEFNKQDRDNDGYIDSTEFSYFIADIGMEYDDFNMLKAFSQIDVDGDQRITLRDFKKWWGSIKFDADLHELA